MSSLWATLADLVVPSPCAACGGRQGERLVYGVCGDCAAGLESLRAFATRPTPAPPGLPPCFALGEYGGELRELIIAFKDRGAHRLARPLGALLAEAVATAWPTSPVGSAVPGAGPDGPVVPAVLGAGPDGPVVPAVLGAGPDGLVVPAVLGAGPDSPVVLAYVPDTAEAARQRHGDHMRALASHAADALRRAGLSSVVVNVLKARSIAVDSAELDAAQRAEAARGRFATRPGVRVSEVVLVDDVITTGSTLAAASLALCDAGVEVRACVALAATQLRTQPKVPA